MSKPSPDSRLSDLIEAGQLAHKALQVPLVERGLQPGDDAVLFMLGAGGMTENELAARLGIEMQDLALRLNRLSEHRLINWQAVGPEFLPGVTLSEQGERLRALFAEIWQELEDALLGDLDKKDRKHVTRALRRFIELLQL